MYSLTKKEEAVFWPCVLELGKKPKKPLKTYTGGLVWKRFGPLMRHCTKEEAIKVLQTLVKFES